MPGKSVQSSVPKTFFYDPTFEGQTLRIIKCLGNKPNFKEVFTVKKRVLASLLVVILAFSMLGSKAFAQSDAAVNQKNGKLMITDPGSYVLQGKLTGCVYVDPGKGDVELILDGVDIDGRIGSGIVAVSGDSLTITLPEGSINRVTDRGMDKQHNAAIYSLVDTVFEGNGLLYVTSNNPNGICAENASLMFNGGNYVIKAQEYGVSAMDLAVTDGWFNIQAPCNYDPVTNFKTNGDNILDGAPSNTSDYSAPANNTTNAEASTPIEHSRVSNGGLDGQQSGISTGGIGGQQPGQQTTLNSAESTSEVVSGTMTNSAASLEADYDNATYITVTDDDSQVTISSSGTYVVSGSSTDGNITVKKGTTGVILVLRDLDLTSTTGATVSVNKEAEVKIVIDGNVVLTDNENPDDENSTDADVADAFDGAALKAKANSQVYVTGDGTLIAMRKIYRPLPSHF